MFVGSYELKLDAKKRLTLPAIFRKELADDGLIFLIPVMGVLYGFSAQAYQEWIDSFFERDGKSFNPRSKRDVELRSRLTSSTTMVEIDSAGRVALGKTGKVGASALAKLGREVTITGQYDHFEVWDSSEWEAKMAESADDFESLMFDNEE